MITLTELLPQINELVAFVADHEPELLEEWKSTAIHIGELLTKGYMAGPKNGANTQGGSRDLSPADREMALFVRQAMQALSAQCVKSADKLKSRQRFVKGLQLGSELFVGVASSAVLVALVKKSSDMAIIPASLSLIGAMFALLSRYVSDGRFGGRQDPSKVYRKLSLAAFDAQKIADELGIYLRFVDAKMISSLVRKANGLARDVTDELSPVLIKRRP